MSRLFWVVIVILLVLVWTHRIHLPQSIDICPLDVSQC